MSTPEETKEAKRLEKESAKQAAKLAAATASKEHYARMKQQGFKKYSFFIKSDTMKKLNIISDANKVPVYQLINKIFEDYIENYTKK